MSNTLKVTATLIPVAVDMRVKAGDRLIVAAGVCIGVYTGNVDIPAIPQVIEHDAPKKPVPTKDAKADKSKPRRASRHRLTVNGEPVSTVRPVVEAIRNVFKTRAEISAKELAELVKKESKDARWRVRDAATYLFRTGELVSSGATANRVYHRADSVPNKGKAA